MSAIMNFYAMMLLGIKLMSYHGGHDCWETAGTWDTVRFVVLSSNIIPLSFLLRVENLNFLSMCWKSHSLLRIFWSHKMIFICYKQICLVCWLWKPAELFSIQSEFHFNFHQAKLHLPCKQWNMVREIMKSDIYGFWMISEVALLVH